MLPLLSIVQPVVPNPPARKWLDALGVIKDQCLRGDSNLHQAYRRNAVDLNCKRHMFLFNEHKLIPKFCFECYKVQIEVDSVIELMKLFLVFNSFKSEKTRKCMVETRRDVSGFYKGLTG